VDKNWIQVAALGSWWEKKQISAFTAVLVLATGRKIEF
jgi:hypothetical protein